MVKPSATAPMALPIIWTRTWLSAPVGAGGGGDEGDGGEGDEDGADMVTSEISEPVFVGGAAGHSVGPSGFTEVKEGIGESSKSISTGYTVAGLWPPTATCRRSSTS